MQPADDHALVVARITQQRAVGPVAVADAGNVLMHPAGAELQLRPDRPVRVLHIQVRTDPGAAAEYRIQIQRRRARVARDQRVLRHAERRGLIERDVVIDELPHERRPRRHGRVIRIGPVRIRRGRVAVHARVDDQRLRSGRQLIPGVHDPAPLADLQQRGADGVIRLREWRQVREDPAEVDATRRRSPVTMRMTARTEHRRHGRLGGGGREAAAGADRARYEPGPGRPQPLQEIAARRPSTTRVTVHFSASFVVSS